MGPVVLAEEGDLVGGPAAFGTDGEGEGSLYIPPIGSRWMGHPGVGGCSIPRLRIETRGTQRTQCVAQCGGGGELLLGFAAEDAGGSGFGGAGWSERGRGGDPGAGGAA